MHNFFEFNRKDLAELLVNDFAASEYRADQLFDWVYRKQVTDFSLMTNLSKEFREKLIGKFIFPEAIQKNCQISKDKTRKYLFQVPGGQAIETVLIYQDGKKAQGRQTLCVSSQYGCGMDCKFCRTGTMGFLANLTTSDIISQVRGVLKDAKNFDDGFTNMVFMGMGEPLHNFKNVVKALEILCDPLAFEVPPGKITVSTVGLVPAIKKFAEVNLGVNLAVSLNATTDEVRSKIMPINQRFPIPVLLDTLKNFPLSGRKKITVEYVMLAGVNDSPQDLKRLPELLDQIPCKINLIPYNSNAKLGFETPAEAKVRTWQRKLMQDGMNATIRWSKGQDIDAACGQLSSSQSKSIAR